MHELALFAGAGGGLLGSKLLGWNTRCAVEIDPYCRSVLLARQRDEVLPRFPIWDDVRTFNGNPWRGHIDIVSGGFPCQDISSAGKGRGITGNRSSLFFEMLRIIEEVEPIFVFAENSPDLRTRGLSVVVEGLTRLGFMGCHGVLGAWHVGASHRRNRMWIVACHSDRKRESIVPFDAEVAGMSEYVTNDKGVGFYEERQSEYGSSQESKTWWSFEPPVDRVVYGLADRVDRVKALGNGQVPVVAATAWRILAPIAVELANSQRRTER